MTHPRTAIVVVRVFSAFATQRVELFEPVRVRILKGLSSVDVTSREVAGRGADTADTYRETRDMYFIT